MKIVLTGAMGFIGANIAHALNAQGDKIIAVDNLTDGNKFINVAGINLLDYCDKNDFLGAIEKKYWGNIDAVIHQGACTSTVESNGCYMLKNNFQYSKELLSYCTANSVPFIYASSAAVYGKSRVCSENDDEKSESQPLNVYGYSKWLFDQYARREIKRNKIPIVGLRYFNVYGAREQHKGRMSSVIYHLHLQRKNNGTMKLFGQWDGYDAGEQKRDFIYVDDAVRVNLFFLEKVKSEKSITGVFNCGSGVARPFNDIPQAIVCANENIEKSEAPSIEQLIQENKLLYISFPDDLKGKYQSYTEADLNLLRGVGYENKFSDLFEGTKKYWPWLERLNN